MPDPSKQPPPRAVPVDLPPGRAVAATALEPGKQPPRAPVDLLAARVAALAERLSALFVDGALGRPALEFLARAAAERRDSPAPEDSPLARLVRALDLSALDVDLLVLAGLPDEHEGFTSVLTQLNPRGEPAPTVALAAQLLTTSRSERAALLRRLWASPLIRHGLLHLGPAGPLPTRGLHLADSLWPVLSGIDAWPRGPVRDDSPIALDGLDEWLAAPDAALALAVLRSDAAATVFVHADDEAVAAARAAALVRAAGRAPLRVHMTEKTADHAGLVCAHALVRGAVPTLRLAAEPGPTRPPLPELPHPGAAVVAARTGATPAPGRPLIPVACDRLSPAALQRMWTRLLPDLADSSQFLAARYPLEPAAARELADGLSQQSAALARPATLADVTAWIRTRGGTLAGSGVQIVRPSAGWDDLVLPEPRLSALRDAVARVQLQGRVLDGWGFLAGRPGARGVRMLFCGPPGTGKTLSAEVLARALGTDLFVIDVSRVVSKWIGETEKNLAEAFDAGERARAVLLFDEADALFGKRTEVADAHDRYANLETAYLLSRLERYEGLAVLTSNLRGNIDTAFMRRMEFVVEFEAPARDERAALWRCHVPNGAPVAPDVSWSELAALYPVVGGVIRNAAVAAAFLAAADDSPITRAHLVRALRREYEKAGKPFPTPRETLDT